MGFSTGLKIKELREAKNLSQEELGAKIGVSRYQISLYESGKNTPPMNRITKLASVFGVLVSDIVDPREPLLNKEHIVEPNTTQEVHPYIKKKLTLEYIEKLEAEKDKYRDELDKAKEDRDRVYDKYIALLEQKGVQYSETWEKIKSLLESFEDRMKKAG